MKRNLTSNVNVGLDWKATRRPGFPPPTRLGLREIAKVADQVRPDFFVLASEEKISGSQGLYFSLFGTFACTDVEQDRGEGETALKHPFEHRSSIPVAS